MSAQDKQNLDTLYSLLGADADTDKISVVYKRKDGHYGLMESN